MFNSTIHLRGISKPIYTSKSQAIKTQEIFENASIEGSYVICLDKYSFRKSEIKSIVIENDGGTSTESDRDLFYEEERQNRKINVAKSPELKSKFIDLFRLAYLSVNGNEPSQETLDKVIATQKDFFQKNPNRTLCDFNLLKPFVILDKENITPYSIAGLRVIEMAIRRDITLSV